MIIIAFLYKNTIPISDLLSLIYNIEFTFRNQNKGRHEK